MDNKSKYDEIFIECFSVNKDTLNDKFVYNQTAEWDSIGHMSLIAELEDAFGITMETDDIIDFSSYSVGKEILKKYDIDIN